MVDTVSATIAVAQGVPGAVNMFREAYTFIQEITEKATPFSKENTGSEIKRYIDRYNHMVSIRQRVCFGDGSFDQQIPLVMKLDNEGRPIKRTKFSDQLFLIKLHDDFVRESNYDQKLVVEKCLTDIKIVFARLKPNSYLNVFGGYNYREDGIESMFFTDLVEFLVNKLPAESLKLTSTSKMIRSWIEYCQGVYEEVLLFKKNTFGTRNYFDPKVQLLNIINQLEKLWRLAIQEEETKSLIDHIAKINSNAKDIVDHSFRFLHSLIKQPLEKSEKRGFDPENFIGCFAEKKPDHIAIAYVDAIKKSQLGQFMYEALTLVGIMDNEYKVTKHFTSTDINTFRKDYQFNHGKANELGIWDFAITSECIKSGKSQSYILSYIKIIRNLLAVILVRESFDPVINIVKISGEGTILKSAHESDLCSHYLGIIEDSVTSLQNELIYFYQVIYEENFSTISNMMESNVPVKKHMKELCQIISPKVSNPIIKNKVSGILEEKKKINILIKASIKDRQNELHENIKVFISILEDYQNINPTFQLRDIMRSNRIITDDSSFPSSIITSIENGIHDQLLLSRHSSFSSITSNDSNSSKKKDLSKFYHIVADKLSELCGLCFLPETVHHETMEYLSKNKDTYEKIAKVEEGYSPDSTTFNYSYYLNLRSNDGKIKNYIVIACANKYSVSFNFKGKKSFEIICSKVKPNYTIDIYILPNGNMSSTKKCEIVDTNSFSNHYREIEFNLNPVDNNMATHECITVSRDSSTKSILATQPRNFYEVIGIALNYPAIDVKDHTITYMLDMKNRDQFFCKIQLKPRYLNTFKTMEDYEKHLQKRLKDEKTPDYIIEGCSHAFQFNLLITGRKSQQYLHDISWKVISLKMLNNGFMELPESSTGTTVVSSKNKSIWSLNLGMFKGSKGKDESHVQNYNQLISKKTLSTAHHNSNEAESESESKWSLDQRVSETDESYSDVIHNGKVLTKLENSHIDDSEKFYVNETLAQSKEKETITGLKMQESRESNFQDPLDQQLVESYKIGAAGLVVGTDHYPFGIKRRNPDTEVEFAVKQTYDNIRKLLKKVKAGTLSYESFLSKIDDLSTKQVQLAFVELAKEIDLRELVKQTSTALGLKQDYEEISSRAIIRHVIEGNDGYALAGRAGFTSATDILMNIFSGVRTFSAVDGLSNILACSIFIGIDVYRWANSTAENPFTTTELVVRTTENVVAGIAAFFGSTIGFTLGAVGGPAGSFMGALVLGFACDWLARMTVRSTSNYFQKRNIKQRKMLFDNALNDDAKFLKINLAVHSNREAHSRFREALLLYHPDKNVNKSEAEKKKALDNYHRAVSAWQIIRQYYDENPGINESDPKHPQTVYEAVVEVFFRFVRDTIDSKWRFVENFFGDDRSPVKIKEEPLEKIEKRIVWM